MPLEVDRIVLFSCICTQWAELRGGGYASTARENKCIEVSLQIAAFLRFSIYLVPVLFLSFSSSEDNELQGLWEPAIAAGLRYLAKTLKGQQEIALEGRGSAELCMRLLEWQSFMSRLIKCPALCFFSFARITVSFACFILPVNNCIHEFWKQIQSGGATVQSSHSSFPCSHMTLKYNWGSQWPLLLSAGGPGWGEQQQYHYRE